MASETRPPGPAWPPKRPVLGVGLSVTTYSEAVEAALAAARDGLSGVVTSLPVERLVAAGRDPALRERVNRLDLVAPAGRPVRGALRLLHRAPRAGRLGGPELLLRLCERAAQEDVGVYLYGGTPDTVGRLRANLRSRFPSLLVTGCESPPARPPRPREDRELVQRIHRSGAGLVFLGMGSPRDEEFAAAHRDRIRAVQVCAGAAFDLFADRKPLSRRWGRRVVVGGLFLAGITADLVRTRLGARRG